MSYIPKKLINPGLYATGDSFIDQTTGKVYTGPYHSSFNGQSFTGVDPYDPNRRPLSANPNSKPPTKVINNPINRDYERVNNKNSSLLKYGKDPLSYTPVTTESDYKRGSLNRYFAKRITEKPPRIIEISSKVYKSLNNKDGKYNYAIWRVSSILWRISGNSEDEVINTNKRQVEIANREFRGIKSYLRNLTQFYKKSEDIQKPSRTLTRGPRRVLEPSSQRPTPSRGSGGGGSSIPRRDLY